MPENTSQKYDKPGNHRVVPYQFIRWFVKEFGFAALLLAFSLGSLSVGLGLSFYQQIRTIPVTSTLINAANSCYLPGKPLTVNAIPGLNRGEIQVSWGLVADASNYVIAMEAIDNPQNQTVLQAGATGNYVIQGLEPGTLYTLQVAGFNDCGIGNFSDSMTAQVQPQGDSQVVGQTQDVLPVANIDDLQSSINDDQLLNIQANLFERGYWYLIGGLVLFAQAAVLAWYGLEKSRKSKKGFKHLQMGFK